MKIIFRLISAALFLIAAAACNLSEINNPDDPNNNGSGKKEYSITAKIIQTRVLYTDGAVLKQEWETGDRLIGYYKLLISTGSGTIAQPTSISFKVKNIIDGIANLELESGTLPEDGTKIALIYDPYGDRELSSGSLSVDICSQNFDIDNQGTSVLPAFMSASAVYTKADGAEFVFHNDCAIIEVDGIYKTGKTSGSEINSVSSIKIENVIAKGTYTFDSSEGKFSLSGSTTEAVTVSCNRTLYWETGALDKPVFLAVIPNENTNNIGVTFSSNTEYASCAVANYGSTAFAPGKCYVIYPKDMVAKTVDNQYFPSVAAAFEHAEYLDGTLGTGVENTVTLVKKEIYGLGENVDNNGDGKYEDVIINIEYPVTLDLNGCNLFLCCDDEWAKREDNGFSGRFQVAPGYSFTIADGTVAAGHIRSNSNNPLIENSGVVTVNNGFLYHYLNNVVQNISSGTLTVNGGELYSEGSIAINNSSTGTVVIEDGMVDSWTGNAIGNLGSLTINGGEIYSEYASAIGSNGGAVNITGGYIHADWAEAIQVYGGTNCDISGGIICSEGSGVNATIRCYSEGNTISTLTIRWPDGISNPSPNTIQGPIIYSGESTSDSVLPVGTYHPTMKNSAKISIVGGYLITNNHSNLFYEDDSGVNLMSNESGKLLFGNFYSNQPSITLYFDTTSSNPIDLYNSGNGDEIRNQLFYADPKGSFVLTDIDFSGDLYKIDPVEVNDGYPGTDLEPVEIGGVIWAPVNCGYDADHPYGLLYQWGRKYGQGYDGKEGEPELVDLDYDPLSEYPDQDDTNAGKFYTNSGALYYFSNIYKLWDSNDSVVANLNNVSQQNPAKTTNDPCPKGWRVPTCYDFSLLEDEDLNNLSLPPAGMRDEYGEVDGRDDWGYYWTSSVDGDIAPSPWVFAFPSYGDSIIQGSTLYGCSIRCVKE